MYCYRVIRAHWFWPCPYINRQNLSPPKKYQTQNFFICGQNYSLEWVSEAGSAPIRSAVTFYFDIDVRIFFNFFKKIFFRSIKKKLKKVENFQKSKIFKENLDFFSLKIFDFLKIFNFFSTFFWSIEKHIF